jgi:hypothetical protein
MRYYKIFLLFLLLQTACKPPQIIYRAAMVTMDRTGMEWIYHKIFRYEKEDTVQYLFDSRLYDMVGYPDEISSLYVCYMPELSSGIMGLHRWCCLPPSLKGFQEIVDKEIFFIPLFSYRIQDSAICFHKMTEDESLLDAQIFFRHIYQKEQTADFLDKNPEVEKIFEQIYDVEYKYLNEQDSLLWKNYFYLGECSSLLSSIPMFYLPLETDVYYKKNLKKYLVKKRLGFCRRLNPLEYDRTATFSHELDTALLALPIKFFQQKYLETRDIYCLDGQTFPLTYP